MMRQSSPSLFEKTFFSDSAVKDSYDFFVRKNWNKQLSETEQRKLQHFFINFQRYVKAMFEGIRNGDFEFSPAKICVLHLDKPRLSYRFEWHERFLLTHFSQVLQKHTQHLLDDSLFSYRKGRSSFTAIERASRYFAKAKEPLYVLREDVEKYTDRLAHSVCVKDFAEWSGESEALGSLLRKICRFPMETESGLANNCIGLPAGTYVNVNFMNLYLAPLDRELGQISNAIYIRFGDDLLFATPDRSTFESARKKIHATVRGRALRLQESKSSAILMGAPHLKKQILERCPDFQYESAIEYLGMQLEHDGRVALPQAKWKKLRAFIRERVEFTSSQMETVLNPHERAERLAKSCQSIFRRSDFRFDNPTLHYLKEIGDPKQLKEMDRWVALLVLKHALKRGFKKSNFRKIGFDQLRAAGLPSFQYLRWNDEL